MREDLKKKLDEALEYPIKDLISNADRIFEILPDGFVAIKLCGEKVKHGYYIERMIEGDADNSAESSDSSTEDFEFGNEGCDLQEH